MLFEDPTLDIMSAILFGCMIAVAYEFFIRTD